MKHMLLLAACIVSTHIIFAQSILKGRVVDAITAQPLIGATIAQKQSSNVVTASDGSFSINCLPAHKLTISFVGYETKQVTYRNCGEELLVALTPSNNTMTNVDISTSIQNKAALYQPMSIGKLNLMELKRGTGLFLDDAINTNLPGVIMQRRAVSSGQQINIRGYGNGVRGTNGISSNFDIQGTKIYLNGIPLTDAEGITLLDDIDFGSIGNVEVVKGPSGTLYGLAIAGVVNLHTIEPEKGKTSVGQEVLVGSYGLRRYTTHFSMGTDKTSLLGNYGYQESDGFLPHNASDKRFVNFAGNIRANKKQSVGFYAGYSNSYDQRAGELTIAQYNAKDYSGNAAYIQRDAHSNIISFRLGVRHTYNFSSRFANTTTAFGTGISNNAASAAGFTDKDPINYGFRSTFDSKLNIGPLALSGVTGVEMQRQNAQVIGYFMKADPANPAGYFKIDTMRSNQAYTTGTKSLFTEWTLTLPMDISLTAGVGWSTMNIDLNDRFVRPNYTRPTHFETSYKDMVSPHVAINKVFSRRVSVYASYSTGYKAPVSSYFFVPVSAASAFLDSTLKPEKGSQFEVGTKGTVLSNKLEYSIAAFRTRYKNKMTAIAVPLNPPAVGTAYSYVANGGSQLNKGIEVAVKYALFQSTKGFFSTVRPFANFTYSKFEYENFRVQALNAARTAIVETNYSGKEVAGVPPVIYNIGFDVTTLPGLYLNAFYNYRGDTYITSDNLNKAESYKLFNMKLGIRRGIGTHFDVDAYFGINNITGEQYYNMIFVNQLPDAYLPAPRNAVYFGGINLKYNL